MKVLEKVKEFAEEYFKKREDPDKKRLISHVVFGAKWCCEDGKHSLYYIRDAIDIKYPIPAGGRNYEEAENASAFELGAYLAYDIYRNSK